MMKRSKRERSSNPLALRLGFTLLTGTRQIAARVAYPMHSGRCHWQRIAAVKLWEERRPGGLSNPDHLGQTVVMATILGIEQ